MHKFLLLATAIGCTAVLTGSAVAASPAAPTKEPPVELRGTVNDKGSKTLKGTTLKLKLDNFFFQSTFIKAKPGTTVKVKLENKGTAPHTFSIDDPIDVTHTSVDKTLNPGKKVTVEVQIPTDGDVVNFYCRFHRTSGMQGAFYTKATATGNNSNTNKNDTNSGGYGY